VCEKLRACSPSAIWMDEGCRLVDGTGFALVVRTRHVEDGWDALGRQPVADRPRQVVWPPVGNCAWDIPGHIGEIRRLFEWRGSGL